MKHFAIAVVLASAAAVGSAATADAQVVYYNAINPYTGGVVSSGAEATRYGTETITRSVNPYTGGIMTTGAVMTPYGTRAASTYTNAYTGATSTRYQYSNIYGTKLYRTSSVNPYSGIGYSSAYYMPRFGTIPAVGYRFSRVK